MAIDLGLLFPVRGKNGLESWMLKSNRPSRMASFPYEPFVDVTSPPRLVVRAARIAADNNSLFKKCIVQRQEKASPVEKRENIF